ncbi:MAG: hypothetical protein GY934_11440 [Gammaproteobacteria bacterium]|nr:hypothetical protein [Gammaproteobacteria bacterium]
MSKELYDSVERIVRHAVKKHATSGIGRVVATYPAGEANLPPNYAVSVEMRDTGLVLPEVPVVVGVMGFASIPALDDLVLVVFSDGDFNAPLVAGCIYTAEQHPPGHADGQLVFRSPAGQADGDLNLVVELEQPAIKLELPGDLELSLSQGEAILRVGKMKLTLSSSGNGEALLEAGSTSMRLKNGQSIEVTAAEISLKADTSLSLEAAQVEIKGSGTVDISGGIVNLN